jgi:hypothetical protein
MPITSNALYASPKSLRRSHGFATIVCRSCVASVLRGRRADAWWW